MADQPAAEPAAHPAVALRDPVPAVLPLLLRQVRPGAGARAGLRAARPAGADPAGGRPARGPGARPGRRRADLPAARHRARRHLRPGLARRHRRGAAQRRRARRRRRPAQRCCSPSSPGRSARSRASSGCGSPSTAPRSTCPARASTSGRASARSSTPPWRGPRRRCSACATAAWSRSPTGARSARSAGRSARCRSGLRSIGVDLPAQHVAGGQRPTGGPGARVRPRPAAGHARPTCPTCAPSTRGGTDVLRPAYDLYGQLWLVDRTAAGARLTVVRDGVARRVVGAGAHRERGARGSRSRRDGTRLVAELRVTGVDTLVVCRVAPRRPRPGARSRAACAGCRCPGVGADPDPRPRLAHAGQPRRAGRAERGHLAGAGGQGRRLLDARRTSAPTPSCSATRRCGW